MTEDNKEINTENYQNNCEDALGVIVEYLQWKGLKQSVEVLLEECQRKNLKVGNASPRIKREPGVGDRRDSGFSSAGRDCSKELIDLFHQGNRTMFFKDHVAAMERFRTFLESCSPILGSEYELLPFFALPYVPEPLNHPAFKAVFQDTWTEELENKLRACLDKKLTHIPLLWSMITNDRLLSPETYVGVSVVTGVKGKEVGTSETSSRKRFQILQGDYQRLLGVCWELTLALESLVKGVHVDLEGTLAGCTHRYPELFSFALFDAKSSPTSLIMKSMQRVRGHPSNIPTEPVCALDFQKIRESIAMSPPQEVLLLLQALRHRLTKITHIATRQAVTMAYIRGDVLGIEVEHQCWSRLAATLTNFQSDPLSQTISRLISALASFSCGRAYLARNSSVSKSLFVSAKINQTDPIMLDVIMPTLQKLSVRGEVQDTLIEEGCIEWLTYVLRNPSRLPPYAYEVCCALMLNLSLRTNGRRRGSTVASSLLTCLSDLLKLYKQNVTPYITGALNSFFSHKSIRDAARSQQYDETLLGIAKECDYEIKSQIEYLVSNLQNELPSSVPVSPPQSPKHLQSDPEDLEEEIDINDPVNPSQNELFGEFLLKSKFRLRSETETAETSANEYSHYSNSEKQEEEKLPHNYNPTTSCPASAISQISLEIDASAVEHREQEFQEIHEDSWRESSELDKKTENPVGYHEENYVMKSGIQYSSDTSDQQRLILHPFVGDTHTADNHNQVPANSACTPKSSRLINKRSSISPACIPEVPEQELEATRADYTSPVPVLDNRVPLSAGDPLLQKLSKTEVTEYVGIFSSRPKVARTPPSSGKPKRNMSAKNEALFPPIPKSGRTSKKDRQKFM